MSRLILALLGTALSFSAYAAYAYTHQGGAETSFSIGTNKLLDRSGGGMKTLDSSLPGNSRIDVASLDSSRANGSNSNSASGNRSASSSNTDPARTDTPARIFEAASEGFANLDFLLAQAESFAELPAAIWDTSLLPDDLENATAEPVLAGLMENANSPSTNLLATTPTAPSRQVNGGGGFVGFTAEPAPVPEPKIYALLIGGIGAVGFVAKRRTAI